MILLGLNFWILIGYQAQGHPQLPLKVGNTWHYKLRLLGKIWCFCNSVHLYAYWIYSLVYKDSYVLTKTSVWPNSAPSCFTGAWIIFTSLVSFLLYLCVRGIGQGNLALNHCPGAEVGGVVEQVDEAVPGAVFVPDHRYLDNFMWAFSIYFFSSIPSNPPSW